jgi:hypothetical protein
VIFAFDRTRCLQHAGRAVALIVPASRFPETKTVAGRTRFDGKVTVQPVQAGLCPLEISLWSCALTARCRVASLCLKLGKFRFPAILSGKPELVFKLLHPHLDVDYVAIHPGVLAHLVR